MTPQEFRDAYVNCQDRLANNLQTLNSLVLEFERLLDQINQDYQLMNGTVEEFITQQENAQGTENQ